MSERVRPTDAFTLYRGEIEGIVDREIQDTPFFESNDELKKASVFLMSSKEVQAILRKLLKNHDLYHPIQYPDNDVSSVVFHASYHTITREVQYRMIQFYLGFDTQALVEDYYNSFLFLIAEGDKALLMVGRGAHELLSGDANILDLKEIWKSTRDPEKTADLN